MACRSCQRCGCTDHNACVLAGIPCMWVAEDVCSACATVEELAENVAACEWLGLVALASLQRLTAPVTVMGRVVSRSETRHTRRSACSATGPCGTSPRKT